MAAQPTKPQSKKEIEMPKPEKIYFKNLMFDVNNPNEMSEEQESALDKLLKRFGFLEPIIVSPSNSKGKQLVHHGEHRIKRLMDSNNTWAWGYSRKLSEVDHRILRQGMNKVHGQHNPEKDAVEFMFLQNKGKLELLASLIAQPVEQLIIEKESVQITQDTEMVQHHEDTFLHGNLKQFYFVFKNDEYEKMVPRIVKIREHSHVDNNTDMFVKMVECYEKTNLKT